MNQADESGLTRLAFLVAELTRQETVTLFTAPELPHLGLWVQALLELTDDQKSCSRLVASSIASSPIGRNLALTRAALLWPHFLLHCLEHDTWIKEATPWETSALLQSIFSYAKRLKSLPISAHFHLYEVECSL